LELQTDDRRYTTVAETSMNLLETLRKVGADGDVDLADLDAEIRERGRGT